MDKAAAFLDSLNRVLWAWAAGGRGQEAAIGF